MIEKFPYTELSMIPDFEDVLGKGSKRNEKHIAENWNKGEILVMWMQKA